VDLTDTLAVAGSPPTGDTLGSYREVTPTSRAQALAALDVRRPIATFSLGETFFEGYPGWGTRTYRQRLAVAGWNPGPAFTGEVLEEQPRGPNRMTSLEERVELSFNLGSKLNGLGHAGIGDDYYGGRRLPDLVTDLGISELDTTTWGPPLLTRGIIIDVLTTADPSACELTLDGRPVLAPGLVTRGDVERAMARQGLDEPSPGDAVLLRTGWGRLVRAEPARFLRGSPGVWLDETRWMASWRPALLGTDSWCWGTNASDVVAGSYGACHQELLVRRGIRIAEGWHLDELLDLGIDRFVLCHNPIRADGAVSTIAPAMAIANVP
jgi:Putative cyclase